MNNRFNSFSSKQIQALKKTRASFAVEVLLTEQLHKLGVSPFSTYLNTLVDVASEETSSSRTLFDEALAWVEKEELPNYMQGVNGIFSRQYSFASKDKVKGLDLLEFETLVMQIVRELTSAPSVNLSNRSVKPLNFEEVHAALKYKVPEVNIDAVYVTSFIVELGERKIFRSRNLVEDVLAYLEHNEIPHYFGEHIGVYAIAYSSQERDLHPQLSTSDINNLVIEVVSDFLI